ncbi:MULTISPECIES: phosphatidate cytidylyltransferase [unclassified Candidatus Frackibacter]|uniref:phosphatidate cytidylyltransferase n=1 Tax=unclassified Candidatus Frackibacter TaxID=2648818 RepID=UPI00087ED999|nr:MULTISPECIES: phosphatidate cytidylyltransferase [unclassified Candidatus Frackibacter]SDB98786.1 phosphatidate cytidylyltransferase [Candidatus Frackibacter sp. WG11]SEM30574.1 phosphatidate cytidylyltransferase [Candidatus Frackibacter sp. WG12]SFL35484.1 phosphatidate cytidylyltransferase [Candidatus Frackibacter sp. WG13]
MLSKRVISAIIGIPLLILVLYQGGILLLLAVMLLAGLGLNEFYDLVKAKGVTPNKVLGIFSGLLLLLFTYLNSKQVILDFTPYLGIVSILILGLIINLFINKGRKSSSILSIATTILGVIYVSGLLLYLILIYHFNWNGLAVGRRLIWLPILSTWATDTFAYFTGINFGRNKLAPKISPNKTIEGALGGMVGSILVVLVYGIWVPFGLGNRIILGILLAVSAQVGDLVESSFKRDAQIKDSGNIIPGHGGVLDRFDSLLFALPIMYYYLYFLG